MAPDVDPAGPQSERLVDRSGAAPTFATERLASIRILEANGLAREGGESGSDGSLLHRLEPRT